MSETTPIVVVAGPTGSGKTALALELARAVDAELVGADSVQVYRGFDIGSAKPTAEELRGVVHHLIDVAEPDEAIDAMRYARLADEAIASAAARGRASIVVGGTGLWIRALVRGLVDLPPVDAALRARLEEETRELGSAAMHARLAGIDPLAAGRIHPNDALRIVRALEVHEQTGTPIGELRAAHALGEPRRPTLFVVLEPDLDALTPRIDERVNAMIEAGWPSEVKALMERWGTSARALSSVGYREWTQHFAEGVPYEETVRAVKHATRLYARRQRNWFRAEPGIDVSVASPDEALGTTLPLVRRHLGR